ncbi:MAG TPA: cytochrome c [Candidatus Binatia bacterium]|nr:cytochrome c [Candidatus Binatia bacterium]
MRLLLLGAIATLVATACSKGSSGPGDGSKIYVANCASCHQVDGKGVAGTFPPLAGNPIVTGNPANLIRIVKYGLTGPVVVEGKRFDGMMPAWHPQLSDDDLAAVLTYVRSAWGAKAGAVTAADVAAVSK